MKPLKINAGIFLMIASCKTVLHANPQAKATVLHANPQAKADVMSAHYQPLFEPLNSSKKSFDQFTPTTGSKNSVPKPNIAIIHEQASQSNQSRKASAHDLNSSSQLSRPVSPNNIFGSITIPRQEQTASSSEYIPSDKEMDVLDANFYTPNESSLSLSTTPPTPQQAPSRSFFSWFNKKSQPKNESPLKSSQSTTKLHKNSKPQEITSQELPPTEGIELGSFKKTAELQGSNSEMLKSIEEPHYTKIENKTGLSSSTAMLDNNNSLARLEYINDELFKQTQIIINFSNNPERSPITAKIIFNRGKEAEFKFKLEAGKYTGEIPSTESAMSRIIEFNPYNTTSPIIIREKYYNQPLMETFFDAQGNVQSQNLYNGNETIFTHYTAAYKEVSRYKNGKMSPTKRYDLKANKILPDEKPIENKSSIDPASKSSEPVIDTAPPIKHTNNPEITHAQKSLSPELREDIHSAAQTMAKKIEKWLPKPADADQALAIVHDQINAILQQPEVFADLNYFDPNTPKNNASLAKQPKLQEDLNKAQPQDKISTNFTEPNISLLTFRNRLTAFIEMLLQMISDFMKKAEQFRRDNIETHRQKEIRETKEIKKERHNQFRDTIRSNLEATTIATRNLESRKNNRHLSQQNNSSLNNRFEEQDNKLFELDASSI